MKDVYRSFIRNLKAACLIGDPETIGLVLLEWVEWPVITSNQPIPEGFLDQVIIPAGIHLSSSSLSDEQLYEFQKEGLAAWRLLAGAALSFRWAKNPHPGLQKMEGFARDPRPDVRNGFARAIQQAGKSHSYFLMREVHPWLSSDSRRVRETALGIMTGMEELTPEILAQITTMNDEEDPVVRAAIVDFLAARIHLGQREWVASVLEGWRDDPASHPWLVEKLSLLTEK